MQYFTTHKKKVFYAFLDNQYICAEHFNSHPKISVTLGEYHCDHRLLYCIENGEEITKEEFQKAYIDALGIINSTFQKL